MDLHLFQVFIFLHEGWSGLVRAGNYCLTASNCTHVYLGPIAISDESTDFLLEFLDVIFIVMLGENCSSLAALTFALQVPDRL